jgi:hypothetical protein
MPVIGSGKTYIAAPDTALDLADRADRALIEVVENTLQLRQAFDTRRQAKRYPQGSEGEHGRREDNCCARIPAPSEEH